MRAQAAGPISCTSSTRELLVRRTSTSTVRGGTSPQGLSPLEKEAISPSQYNLVCSCISDGGDIDAVELKNPGPALFLAIDSPWRSWRLLKFA